MPKKELLVDAQSCGAIIKSAVLSDLEELDKHILSSVEEILGDLILIFEVDYSVIDKWGLAL